MRIARLLAAASSLSLLSAAEQPGRAAVDWLAASESGQPGEPVLTGVRMVLDEGHHTYWVNPGESGVPVWAKFELPPGWKSGGLLFPRPVWFTNGGLVGFGYDGTVIFPVEVTPPADFAGETELKGTVEWLACSETECVPGKREISLKLRAGPAVATAADPALRDARALVPEPAAGLVLEVKEADEKQLELTLKVSGNLNCDPSASAIFPATPEVIDPAAAIDFTRRASGVWAATLPKSEYLSGPAKSLTLVLAGPGTPAPLSVFWDSGAKN